MSEKLKCAVETCKEQAYTGNALALVSPVGTLVVYVCQRHFAEYCQPVKKFEHPAQTAPAVGAAYQVDRSTLTRAFNGKALKKAAYRSGDTILIDTSHPDFAAWLSAHESWLSAHEQIPRIRKRISEKSQN